MKYFLSLTLLHVCLHSFTCFSPLRYNIKKNSRPSFRKAAGTQHNVIPDRCTFVVDIRSNECYSNQELFDEIQKHITCEAKARSFRLSSSHVAPEHPVVQKAIAMKRTPFGSPTLSDQALMPFPSLKMGPGKSARSHTADEFIFVKEIEKAIGMYLELLEGVKI